ncbi:MAG: hypothetical protein WA746_20855, partial [Isosphaeraceae bacterium]
MTPGVLTALAIWAGPLSMPMKSSGQRMIPAARGTEHVCVLMRIGSLLCGSVDAPLTAAGRYRIFQLARNPKHASSAHKVAHLL